LRGRTAGRGLKENQVTRAFTTALFYLVRTNPLTDLALITLAVGAIFIASARAAEYSAIEVRATDGIVKCNAYRDLGITATSGPCADFIPPSTLAIGQQFSVGGVSHNIRVLVATQNEKDYSSPELTVKKGEWYCTAAENESDLDMEGSESRRLWLSVPHCEPLR
jgi:hypothetical protein